MRSLGRRDFEDVTTDQALETIIDVLGDKYEEVRPGVYVNDQGYQVRITDYDLTGHKGRVEPHVNIETTKAPKGPKYHLRFKD